MTGAGLTNGFRIRGLNQDADRLAIQSTHQTTRPLGRNRTPGGRPQWQEIGIAQDELIVCRPYNGAPVIEIQGLGGPHGVLIVEATRQFTRTLRNGSRLRVELGQDESLVIKTETWRAGGREHPASV